MRCDELKCVAIQLGKEAGWKMGGKAVRTEHCLRVAKISNLWPQLGKQIKWKIVCFDFYLVGHVLKGLLSSYEGGGGKLQIVESCGWPLNFWRDLQFAATLQPKLFANKLLQWTPRQPNQLTAWTHSLISIAAG